MKNNYSTITDEELLKHVANLTSKAAGMRKNILKECDLLEVMYKELIAIKAELESRKTNLDE